MGMTRIAFSTIFKAQSTVEVYLLDARGNQVFLSEVVVTRSGMVLIDVPYDNGEKFIFIGKDNNDRTLSYPYTIADRTPPNPPTDLAISADGLILTGNAQPEYLVEVKNSSGQVIGSVRANTDGTFSVPLSSPQVSFEKLSVTASDPGGSSPPTGITAPCFLAGTLIATPQGEVAVEDLRIGDLVTTAEGGSTPVLWVGVKSMRFGALRERDFPVLIAKDALGPNMPQSDLMLSADHGVALEDLIINAGQLINGAEIRYLGPSELSGSFTYYHVETRDHDEILANGLRVETFIDYIGRKLFDNYDEYLALYGADRIIPEMKKKRVSSRRQLPDAIAARFGALHSADIEEEMRNLSMGA